MPSKVFDRIHANIYLCWHKKMPHCECGHHALNYSLCWSSCDVVEDGECHELLSSRKLTEGHINWWCSTRKDQSEKIEVFFSPSSLFCTATQKQAPPFSPCTVAAWGRPAAAQHRHQPRRHWWGQWRGWIWTGLGLDRRRVATTERRIWCLRWAADCNGGSGGRSWTARVGSKLK